MRLVMIHEWCVEWAASGEVTIPIEYESPEAAIVDFEKIALETYKSYCAFAPGKARIPGFTFEGVKFDVLDFFSGPADNPIFDAPFFLTIDEWFAQKGANEC